MQQKLCNGHSQKQMSGAINKMVEYVNRKQGFRLATFLFF